MSARVLLVLGSSAGGVARHVGQAARLLDAAGWAVRVAGPAAVRELVAPAALDVVEITDRPRPGTDVRAVRALRRLGRRADVVHAHGLRAGALAVLAVRGLRRAGAQGDARRGPRVVVTLHNLPVGGRAVRVVSGVLERVVVRGSDVVLGVSPDLVDRARAAGAADVGLALVPAPRTASRTLSGSPERAADDRADGDARALRRRLGLADGERLVVTVGRLAPQKGTAVLADAAALIPGALARTEDAATRTGGGSAPWRWAVAGDGPLRDDLAARVRASGAPVELLGTVDDVPALLRAADVVVSTAVWEGQPLWLQEALGEHAAIVATDAGGTRSVVGDAAVLVPVGDAAGVAREVARLLVDDAARGELRARAARRAAALPTPHDVLVQLEGVYRETRATPAPDTPPTRRWGRRRRARS